MVRQIVLWMIAFGIVAIAFLNGLHVGCLLSRKGTAVDYRMDLVSQGYPSLPIPADMQDDGSFVEYAEQVADERGETVVVCQLGKVICVVSPSK